MRRNKHHIGRLRIQAAKILARNFPDLDISPEDISPATGRNRSDWRMDVYRWELFTRTKLGRPKVVGCWETLTNFVKLATIHGCHISDGEIHLGKPVKSRKLIEIL